MPDTSVNHFFADTVGVLCHFDDSVSFTVSRCKFKSVTGLFFSDILYLERDVLTAVSDSLV